MTADEFYEVASVGTKVKTLRTISKYGKTLDEATAEINYAPIEVVTEGSIGSVVAKASRLGMKVITVCFENNANVMFIEHEGLNKIIYDCDHGFDTLELVNE